MKSIPGLLFRKRHGSAFSTAGDPDLYGCWHGRHFEIELKKPRAHPTPIQTRRLAEWKAAGAAVSVVHSIPELHAFLKTFLAS